MGTRAEQRLCGAKNRQGESCRAVAMANGRCRNHGGKSLSGAAHPRFRDGRRSRYLPKRLLAQYAEAMQDEELLSLRADIALVDSRLVDVLQHVESGESWRLWHDLHKKWQAFTRVYGRDETAEGVAFAEVHALIRNGYHDWAAWQDVLALIQQRRKLVESERRAMVENQRVISVEQAAMLLALLVDSVRREVTDRTVLRRVTETYAQLVGQPPPPHDNDGRFDASLGTVTRVTHDGRRDGSSKGAER